MPVIDMTLVMKSINKSKYIQKNKMEGVVCDVIHLLQKLVLPPLCTTYDKTHSVPPLDIL